MNQSQVGFISNIEQDTVTNANYRHVIFTGPHLQLVLMSLKPGLEIGMEVHETNDQFFRVEKGTIKAILNGEETVLTDGMVVVIPAGTQHNIINTGAEDAKLYTIYTPAVHPDGTLEAEKPAND